MRWTPDNVEELCGLVLSPPRAELSMDEWCLQVNQVRLWPRSLRTRLEPGTVVLLRIRPEVGRSGFAAHALVEIVGRHDDGYRGRVLRAEREGPPQGMALTFGPQHVLQVVLYGSAQ